MSADPNLGDPRLLNSGGGGGVVRGVRAQTADVRYRQIEKEDEENGGGYHPMHQLFLELVSEYKKGLAVPVYQLPCKYSTLPKDIIDKRIYDMLQHEIIQYSSGSYASPVVLVKKNDGSWRVCVADRGLNNQTIKDKYPTPLLANLLDELGSPLYFSKLDLRAGFHKLCMAPYDIYKTAFKTHSGHYEHLVMPFGLLNAPFTFPDFMNHIFRNISRMFLLVFLDDISIYSQSRSDNIQHLLVVFSILRENQLYLKLSKCTFGVPIIEYMNVVTILNSNHTVQYSVRCSDLWLRTHHTLELPSVQENLIVPRTCAEIYLMELEVPVGMWCFEEILWPPDATKLLITLGPILWDFSNLQMTFTFGGIKHVLCGVIKYVCKVVKGSRLNKLMLQGDDMSRNEELQNLISSYTDLFEKPADLPPFLKLLIFLKLSKCTSPCTFGVTIIEYLGLFISATGVTTDPAKLSVINQWPIPTNQKQLRSFLRVANYYRRLIQNYSIIDRPLTNLLKKDDFLWSSESDQAFNNLKTALSNPPVLALPHFENLWRADPNSQKIISEISTTPGAHLSFTFVNKELRRKENLVIGNDPSVKLHIFKWLNDSAVDGHSERDTTLQRIKSLFFWPQMNTKVLPRFHQQLSNFSSLRTRMLSTGEYCYRIVMSRFTVGSLVFAFNFV